MSQKVAYVTGGMGGIGTAICQRMHKEGFTVIAGCGPTRDFDKWVAEQKALGYTFHASVGNVGDWQSTCDAFTTDASGLAASRSSFPDPENHIILPEIISKEPLGPSVRKGDDQWLDVVKWTQFVLVTAEELGVTQANVDAMLKSENPEIKRLLGTEGKYGESLGLSNDWGYRIIKHVGNYGESFERNVGQGSPLKIARGLNALWNKGGLQYAPPIR